VKILVAPCAYKGTIEASHLAQAIAQGIKESQPSDNIEIALAPVADGGDDTLACLQLSIPGDLVYSSVIGPVGQPVEAAYWRRQSLAVVELAQASGIAYLQNRELSALRAHTFGTGQVIARAIADGANEIVIMLGGSASTDGGSGVLAALGAEFYDFAGVKMTNDAICGGGSLYSVARIDLSALRTNIAGIKFLVATDVTNPLLGPLGAAAVFSPQKGASIEEVIYLEKALEHFAALLEAASNQSNISWRNHPGAGAAGGAGFGLVVGLGAQFTSGFHWLAEKTGLAEKLNWCDLVVVAEGCLDSQSLAGKATGEILKLAQAASKRVVAIPACCQLKPEQAQLFAAVLTTASQNQATLDSVRSAAQLIIGSSGASSRS